MTLGETLILVWQQSLADGREKVDLGHESYPVTVFRAKRLRSVEFSYGELRIIGIEQNPQRAPSGPPERERERRPCIPL